MNRFFQLLICVPVAVAFCQCSFLGKKKAAAVKKKDTSNMSLAQRSMLKPDESQRSSFEKFITNPSSKSNAGGYFQKQMHHSKSFNGGDSYAGQKQFKTGQSWFGKSQNRNADMTYALGDKRASGAKDAFKTDASRFGRQQAHEGDTTFSGADSVFKSGSALTRSRAAGKAPLIIENFDATSTKKSAYSEDDVRKLLNRN